MIKYCLLVIVAFCYAFSFAQTNSDFYILQSFSVNGETVKLDNNFKIYYVSQQGNEKIIYSPEIHNDTIFLSTIQDIPIKGTELKSVDKKQTCSWVLMLNGDVYILNHSNYSDFKNGCMYQSTINVYFWRSDYNNYFINQNVEDIVKQENEGYVYVVYDGSFGIFSCIPIQRMEKYFEDGRNLLDLGVEKSFKKSIENME